MPGPEDLIKSAEEAERQDDWVRARMAYVQAARECAAVGQNSRASDLYMLAAGCGERAEDWRDVGFLWIMCARTLEEATLVSYTRVQEYETLDAAKHFFPTIAPEYWRTLSKEERRGRAFRNAAYHLDKAGVNQTAYTQFRESGLAFERAEMWSEASRSYYYANLSFIQQHGELDSKLLEALERINRILIGADRGRYLKRLQLHYRMIRAELVRQGNQEEGDQVFIKELDVTRNILLLHQHILQWTGYTLWRLTSLYGTSFWRWLGWAAVLIIAVFPFAYMRLPLLVETPEANWLDHVYFSFLTFMATGAATVPATPLGKAIVASEVFFGLLMISLLISMVVRKVIR